MLAHLDDRAAIAFDLFAGRRDCAEQRGGAIADFGFGLIGQGIAIALEAIPAGIGFNGAQIGQDLVQNGHGTWNDFTAHAIAGDDAKSRGV